MFPRHVTVPSNILKEKSRLLQAVIIVSCLTRHELVLLLAERFHWLTWQMFQNFETLKDHKS